MPTYAEMGDGVSEERDRCLSTLRTIKAEADEHKRKEEAGEERFTWDIERDHARADEALLDCIADEEITAAFGAIYKWYA